MAFFLSTQKAIAIETERLIVKFKPVASLQNKLDLIKSANSQAESLKLKDTFVLTVPTGTKDKVIQALGKNFLVEYVEEDFRAQSLYSPNDPDFTMQWGLTKIRIPQAWDTTQGSGNVYVAIIDTGINSYHPDFAGKIVLSINCTLTGCPSFVSTDPDGHGTHVAGIVGATADNGIGIAGTAWESKLFLVKALNDNGSGFYSWIANAIIAAVDNGAQVINLSLGGTASSLTLQNAVDYAWNKGAVVVAAAGNSGSTRKFYPAYYTNVIAVGAVDNNDQKANFSNYGSWVDVSAPGVNIYSTYGNTYKSLSGTSMATPFVSGLAALLIGQNPSLSNNEIKNRIESTANKIPGTGTYWLHGRIDACSAVGCSEIITGSSPSPTTSPTPAPTPSPTPAPTPTPTSSSLSPTPTPNPTQTPTTPKPWWCKYLPNHSTCQ